MIRVALYPHTVRMLADWIEAQEINSFGPGVAERRKKQAELVRDLREEATEAEDREDG